MELMKLTPVLRAAALASVFALSMAHAAQAVTLNTANGGEPGSLDPHKISGNWEDRIVSDFLEGLMAEDIKAEPIPGQAESYTLSDDGLVYTFKLRPGITWTDGVPVTAQDFEFAFRRLFDPKEANEYAYLQYPIKNSAKIAAGEITDFNELGVKALDDTTLEITLESPTPFFLKMLCHFTSYPLPRHVLEKHGADWTKVENLVANGPFKIVEWVPGSYIRATKNDTYYDAANVKIDEVTFNVSEDLAAAFNRYRAGEFDIMTDFPTDQYELIKEQLPGQSHVIPFLGIYYYLMNQEKPEFQDIRVRQALSLAVNRDVIGPDVLGTGELPAYGWVPEGTANFDGETYMPDWASLPYEERVAKAAALMAEAGYTPENPLKIQLRYNTNDNHQRIAVAISAMWKPIGVEVELFNAETAVHYDALRAGDFQVARAGWLLDYSDASNVLDLLKTGVENNYGQYSNAEFDALLKAASTEQDLLKRSEMLHQAEKIAMDEFAAIPIYWYVSKNIVSPKVSGFEDNADDIHRHRWMSKSE
jgi:oligopeptide transport system substrate-binding protein